MRLPSPDFESGASTYSATPALFEAISKFSAFVKKNLNYSQIFSFFVGEVSPYAQASLMNGGFAQDFMLCMRSIRASKA
jgi:hypothetical protein